MAITEVIEPRSFNPFSYRVQTTMYSSKGWIIDRVKDWQDIPAPSALLGVNRAVRSSQGVFVNAVSFDMMTCVSTEVKKLCLHHKS